MDGASWIVHRKILKRVAKKYKVTEADLRRILVVESETVAANLNSIDLQKDLTDQYTRICIRNVGTVQVQKPIVVTNDLRYGIITKAQYEWAKIWFKQDFKRCMYLIENIYNKVKRID